MEDDTPPKKKPLLDDLPSTVAAAKAGNPNALNSLCDRLYPMVERMVQRSLNQDIRSKRPWMSTLFSTGDIVQEVFVGVLRDLDEPGQRSDEDLLRYMATLTKNRLVDSIRFYEASRRDRRRTSSTALTPNRVEEDSRTPEDAAIHTERVRQIHQTLATFSVRDAGLLRERLENGLEFSELANLFGFASADTCRKAFHLAQAKLLQRMKKAGIDG